MSSQPGSDTSSDPKSAAANHALQPKAPAAPLGELKTGAGDPAPKSRKSLIASDQEEKATQLGLREPLVTGAPSYPRPPNLRRTAFAVKLFGIMTVLMLLMFAALVAGLFSYYQKKIEPQLRSALSSPKPIAVAEPVSPPPPPAAVKVEVPAAVTEGIAEASARIAELQKQIDALRDTQAATDARLRETADRVASQRPATSLHVPPTPATEAKEEPTVASILPPTSEANKELVLLKERNRLTAYADEAISTGNRKALNVLIQDIQDPEMAHLRHAVFAEIQRVYYHLRFTSRIDPNFKIPVNELFKDPGIRDESDLKTEKVVELMHDPKQPWEVRLRAAYLLGGRRTREVGDALIKAIRDDPILDVAKEAQLSFEQNMNHKFLLLDLPSIESWWKTQTTDVGNEPQRKQDAQKK